MTCCRIQHGQRYHIVRYGTHGGEYVVYCEYTETFYGILTHFNIQQETSVCVISQVLKPSRFEFNIYLPNIPRIMLQLCAYSVFLLFMGVVGVGVGAGRYSSVLLHWCSLRWRHDGRDGISNHQHQDCLLSRLFRRRSKRTSKLRVTGLCVGIHRWPVNCPHKWPVTRKMVPFDDVIIGGNRTIIPMPEMQPWDPFY